MHSRVLTGITTTGTPHLGNYVGAIRPAIAASRRADVDAFYFMADYHALIKSRDADRIERSRLEIAATWLAAGLDPERVTFYRQSDIPEIPQLTWFLTCVASKGMLNRAHAYKAMVETNAQAGEDPDAGVTAGLYMYPVLMAADILAFDANQVPVGRDQIQHIEMARDLAQRFNHLYGHDFFVLPEALIEEQVATLPGLDGRKMSKSYDNTVPLFGGGAKATRAAILRIVTDSLGPGEPKVAEGSTLYTIYRAFAAGDEATAFRRELERGLGWGDAKDALVTRIEQEVGPMRERYAAFMADPGAIEEILERGAAKARAIATPKIAALRDALGLRKSRTRRAGEKPAASRAAAKAPRLASFRDADGRFRFRLFSGHGDELALSVAFDDPKAAGAVQKRLQAAPPATVRAEAGCVLLELDGAVVARSADGLDATARDAIAVALASAIDQLTQRG